MHRTLRNGKTGLRSGQTELIDAQSMSVGLVHLFREAIIDDKS